VAADGGFVVLAVSTKASFRLGLHTVDKFRHLLMKGDDPRSDHLVRCTYVLSGADTTTSRQCEMDVTRADGGVVLQPSLGGEFRLDPAGVFELRAGLVNAGNQAAIAGVDEVSTVASQDW